MSLPKPNKKPLNKITSFLLVVFLLVQIVGGILVPIEISMNPLRITSNQASAAWYDSSWTKRKAITVTENSGADLTSYQVNITVPYDSDMQADFDDIRFADTDGSTLIDHWLESKTDSTTAEFWIEIPTLTASSDKTIYMYYGNDNVGVTSASNFDNTFTKDYSSDAELVGQWNMDEGTGTTITDSSTNSNTGTLGGDGAGDDLPAWAGPPDGGVSGIDGTSVFLDGDSLSFDGTDDYVDCGAENSLHITDAITIELWINATSWNLSDKNVIVTSGNEQYGYMLYQNSGVIQFRLWNNYSSVALAQFTTVQVPVSEWHHLIGVWDGTNISIYLDGILKNTNVGTPPEPNNR